MPKGRPRYVKCRGSACAAQPKTARYEPSTSRCLPALTVRHPSDAAPDDPSPPIQCANTLTLGTIACGRRHARGCAQRGVGAAASLPSLPTSTGPTRRPSARGVSAGTGGSTERSGLPSHCSKLSVCTCVHACTRARGLHGRLGARSVQHSATTTHTRYCCAYRASRPPEHLCRTGCLGAARRAAGCTLCGVVRSV